MTLIKSTSIYTISKLLNQAIPFLLLPILTKYLTPTDYGTISIFNTIFAFLIIFISLGIPSLVGVEFAKKNKNEFIIFITNSLFLIFLSTVFLFTILFLFNKDLSEILKLSPFWLICILIMSFFKVLFNIYLIILRFENKIIMNVSFELSQLLINIIFSLSLIIIFSMNWEGRAIGILISVLLLGILSTYKLYFFYFNSKYISLKNIKEIIKFSLPIIPHNLAMWVRGGFDIILITYLLNEHYAGIYSLGFQLATIIGIIGSSIIGAITPYLYEKMKNDSENKNIVVITYIFFIFIFVTTLIVNLFYNWVIPVYLNKEYIEVIDIISLLLYANIFLSMYYIISIYFFYEKKTYLLSKLTVGISILHVIISFILIEMIGIRGAAIAIFITYLLSFIIIFKLSYKVYPMPWLLKKEGKLNVEK